jgi:hypothetical protein
MLRDFFLSPFHLSIVLPKHEGSQISIFKIEVR